MNLSQLKYFQAVCQFGTITRASKELHISQPSISSAIRELEEEYGVILFQRRHHGMVMTEAGKRLLTMSRTLLSETERLNRVMTELSDERKILQIGIPSLLSLFILPKVIEAYKRKRPDVRIRVESSGRKEVFELLTEGELDLAILPCSTSGCFDSIYHAVPLFTLELGVCVSPCHPLSRKPVVTIEDLQSEDLVVFEQDYLHKEILFNRFKDEHLKPNILLETSQFSTILSLVQQGAAVSFVLKDVVEEEWMKIKYIPISPQLSLDIRMIWRTDDYMFQSMKDFIHLMETMDKDDMRSSTDIDSGAS